MLIWLGPPGVDFAAHAYQRTFLLQHGFAIWNNFWYAGRYSFVTYSFIYYPLAALLGIKLLAVASIGVAALAFALVVWREWGPAARFSSRTFAVLWAGVVLSAAFPFALGTMFALLALVALQTSRRRLFAALLFLTLLASPLALLLLVLVLAGCALDRRRAALPSPSSPPPSASSSSCAAFSPSRGTFRSASPTCSGRRSSGRSGSLVTARVPAARRLFGLFAMFLAALHRRVPPTERSRGERRAPQIHGDPARAARRDHHTRSASSLRSALVAVAGFWNISALAHTAAAAGADPAHSAAYWQPAIAFLRANLTPSFRVEAVDTIEHWPAAYLPDAGIPIVRGWYRQNDFPQNELLYDRTLAARAYQCWLRGLGVRYVVLTDAPPDYSSRAEAALVRSGRSGLMNVFTSAHVDVYEVPHPQPLVTGAGDGDRAPAHADEARLLGLRSPAATASSVRWSPYWQHDEGCVWQGPDGTVRLQATHAGLVSSSVELNVSRGLETLDRATPRRAAE